MSEEIKIEFHDKRRIKSADDVCDDAVEADVDRLPTFVEKLKVEMEANDQRLREYIAAHREKMAEMDQVRKRLEGDVERRASEKFGSMVRDLFPFLDDFDRAIEQAARTGADGKLIDGVRIAREGLFRVLASNGVEMINCEGEQFDPETAQAVAIERVEDESKDNIVIEQLAPGYMFAGRVLRHALVRVGKKADLNL